jgi:hypothetical protein
MIDGITLMYLQRNILCAVKWFKFKNWLDTERRVGKSREMAVPGLAKPRSFDQLELAPPSPG